MVLLSYPENKPVDVLLYTLFTPAERSFAFDEVEYDLPGDPVSRKKNQDRSLHLMGIAVTAYLVRGSLDGLVGNQLRPFLNTLKPLDAEDEDLKTSDFLSVGILSNNRLPDLVVKFQQFAPILPGPFVSKIKLKLAGNRPLKVILDIKQSTFQTFGIHPFLDLITDPAVLGGSPYISLHPDHPANPMANASNFVYALIGDYGRRNNVRWETVFARNKGLYIESIRQKLMKSYGPFKYREASLERMTNALSPQYSLANL